MSGIRIGSMCTGYGGLDLAVQAVLGGEMAWFAENDPDASCVLAHHWPTVPNLGDLTTVDWTAAPPVDVVCAGFPCQSVSFAGKRAGLIAGAASGLWAHIAVAIAALDPRVVVIENVGGLRSARAGSDVEPCPWCLGDPDKKPHLRALGAVLADLATLGFDAVWTSLRASDVGAAHPRERVFLTAWPATHPVSEPGFQRRIAAPRQTPRGRTLGSSPGRGRASAVADATGQGLEAGGQGLPRTGAPANTQGNGRDEGRPEPARLRGGPDAALSGKSAAADTEGQRRQGDKNLGSGQASLLRRPNPDRCSGAETEWGAYEPAIRRWEHVTGRPVPPPTEPGRTGERLSPVFVEWLLGLAEGHVTAVPGLSRGAMLRILGNGVVPQQAETALALLLPAMEAAA